MFQLNASEETRVVSRIEKKWFPGGLSSCAQALAAQSGPEFERELRRQLQGVARSSELRELNSSVQAAIDRVDAFEVRVTYAFPVSKVGVRQDTIERMKREMSIYSVITEVGGKSRYGIAKGMFGDHPSPDESAYLDAVDAALRILKSSRAPVLIAWKRGENGRRSLRDLVFSKLGMGFVGPVLLTKELPGSIAIYELPSPRGIERFPPPLIAASEEYWFIPDKNLDDPEIEVTWRYRVYSQPATGLRLLRDFQSAELVVFAPAFNPDLDGAPALGAYSDSYGFGRLTQSIVLVAGQQFVWKESGASVPEELISPPREAAPSRPVGRLVNLSLAK